MAQGILPLLARRVLWLEELYLLGFEATSKACSCAFCVLPSGALWCSSLYKPINHSACFDYAVRNLSATRTMHSYAPEHQVPEPATQILIMRPLCSHHTQRREREGLAAGDTDPALDELSDDDYVFQEEPPELVAARNQLAGFTAQPGIEEPAGEVWLGAAGQSC